MIIQSDVRLTLWADAFCNDLFVIIEISRPDVLLKIQKKERWNEGMMDRKKKEREGRRRKE